MQNKEFHPGFRLSASDAAVLLLGVFGVWFFSTSHPLGAFIIGCALGHFFLFCNVFRIARKLEFIWAACFVALVLVHSLWGVPSLPGLGCTVSVLAIVLIVLEMRQPGYHGILWRKVNPRLETWWKSQG